MVFGDTLSNLVNNVPGAVGASVMGFDGIPLEEFKKKEVPMEPAEFDLSTIGVEYSGLIQDIKKNAQNLGIQGIQEISLKADPYTFIIRPINDEYFAILALVSSAYFGKGRYLLRRVAFEVKSQL